MLIFEDFIFNIPNGAYGIKTAPTGMAQSKNDVHRVFFFSFCFYSIRVISVFILCTVGALSGCTGNAPTGSEILVRVSDRTITMDDFQRALESAKTAYSHNALQDPDVLADVRVRLLNQLIEELMLLKRAEELDIHISDREVEAAVTQIKNDYPEDSFEQALLDHAVTYAVWKDNLKIRLIKEKVISEAIEKGITVTEQDISDYKAEHDAAECCESDSCENAAEENKRIFQTLYRKKTEDAYRLWLKELQKRYAVEINQNEWKKVTNL